MSTQAKSANPASKRVTGSPAPNPCGTDIALTVAGVNGRFHKFSYWDLWFAVAAEQCFGGKLEALAEHFRTELKSNSIVGMKAREKLSHLRDLQHRLSRKNLQIVDLLRAVPQLAHQERRRARGRVMKHNERQYERSEPMCHLPREWKWQHALRGRWSRFPVSPAPTAEQITRMFARSRYYSEDESWDLVRRLEPFLVTAQQMVQAGRCAEAQALLRGWITGVLELIENADDSFGVIGQTFGDGFRTYLDVPLAKTGIVEAVFFEDLLDLLMFEDYAFTTEPTEGYFRRLSQRQADFCLEYTRRQVSELKSLDLDYQSEEALTLVGQIAAEQRRFDQFEALAGTMGATHWQRIIRLVDAAMKKQKRALAEKVFQAALGSKQGSHLEFLQRKYEELKRGRWKSETGR